MPTDFQKSNEYYEGRKIGYRNGYPSVSWKGHPAGSQGHYWVYIHRIEWYKHHGPIAPDYVVHHKDHNRANWAIENLELMHRLEHAKHHAEKRFGPMAPPAVCGVCRVSIKRRKSQQYGKVQFCSREHSEMREQPKKIDWPATEVLLDMLTNSSYSAVARVLGVSDNAIRKRLKVLEKRRNAHV